MGVILTYNSHPEAAHAVVQKIEVAGGKAVALHPALGQFFADGHTVCVG